MCRAALVMMLGKPSVATWSVADGEYANGHCAGVQRAVLNVHQLRDTRNAVVAKLSQFCRHALHLQRLEHIVEATSRLVQPVRHVGRGGWTEKRDELFKRTRSIFLTLNTEDGGCKA